MAICNLFLDLVTLFKYYVTLTVLRKPQEAIKRKSSLSDQILKAVQVQRKLQVHQHLRGKAKDLTTSVMEMKEIILQSIKHLLEDPLLNPNPSTVASKPMI